MTTRFIATQCLDHGFDQFQQGAWVEAIHFMVHKLGELRKNIGAKDFQDQVVQTALKHPICQFLHQDPFTRHSFNRPRGYAGDATLIDFMYGLRQPEETDTELGKILFEQIMQISMCKSARYRRERLGSQLENLALSAGCKVLSVAAGHFREALLAPTLRENPEIEITTLDQDAQSLEEIRRMSKREKLPRINTVQTDLKPLLLGQFQTKRWDFVYAAGLYDYLPDRLAQTLTHKMFELLRPGGKLLVANFIPGRYEQGYMETFMDWSLIYRDRQQVLEFSADIPAAELASSTCEADPEGNVYYLELQKS